jgi:ankyrin repeat protein
LFSSLNELSVIIELLLRRGADPSLSAIPYPALCYAVAAGDVKIVKLLIEKGADCNRRMPKKVFIFFSSNPFFGSIFIRYSIYNKYSSLTPLSLACGVYGEHGPQLVKLLLDSLADPNASADKGDEYLSMSEKSWITEKPSEVPNLFSLKFDEIDYNFKLKKTTGNY